MVLGEQAALEGLLSRLRPRLAIEIGTAEGGSLRCLARHCEEVHSFDLEHGEELEELPGVELHSGDSHVLLPAALAKLEREGRNVDFVLVDGDHTAEGVRRDMEDLLASGALRSTVILAHDAGNDEVRQGLEAVDYAGSGKVVAFDLDFVAGHLSREGAYAGQLWGGFALVVAAAGATDGEPETLRPDMYPAFEVLRQGRRQLQQTPPQPAAGGPLPEPELPWTEARLARSSPHTRLRVQFAWERLPRPSDLADPRGYVQGLRLHRELFHQGHTMLYPLRGRTLHQLARRAEHEGIPGALVDCGTWNGGSTALLAAGDPKRHVWAFDSFQGLPAPSERDAGRPIGDEEAALYVGECYGSEEMLRAAVTRFVPAERLHVRPGWFEDTLPDAAVDIGPIAVLHCDSDWYDSVTMTLEALYPSIVRGGFIVIDDYGAVPGAGQATRDFKARVGDTAPLVKIDQTGRYWRKP